MRHALLTELRGWKLPPIATGLLVALAMIILVNAVRGLLGLQGVIG